MSAILKFIRENHILALIEQAIAKKKSRLSLNGYEIAEIPDLLYRCFEVEHLYLHKNKITSVPVQIVQLVSLTTLALDYNNISRLPSEIGNLKNLVNLNISHNPLGVLIPEIGQLENLEAFWCNRIGLKEIPKEIGKLVKLDTFGARSNELKTIPEEMTQLAKLRWLTLENNQIESLPKTMYQMKLLVHCNLRNNRIVEFPESVLKCGELMFLQLNSNRISSLPEIFDTSSAPMLEIIDLRENPVAENEQTNVMARSTLLAFAEEERRKNILKIERRRLRDMSNPMQLPEREFVANFRLSKAGFLQVLEELRPYLPQGQRNTAVRNELKAHRLVKLSDVGLAAPEPEEAPPARAPLAGTALRPPAPRRPLDNQQDEMPADLDMDGSSASSEDWENSLNSSELDVQYQSDDERIDNDAVGMVLPELSRYASTAS